MKKKLKLNKKTIAELSGTESIVGGAGKTNDKICLISQNKQCYTILIKACSVQVCLDSVSPKC